MKKTVFAPLFCLLALAFLLNGCGAKYADVKKMNDEYINLVQTYISDLEKADSAKACAKAIDQFADRLDTLWPKMKKLSEKYPELKDRNNIPEELKDSQKKAEDVGKQMGQSFMKLMPYMKDPEVQAAQKRLGEIMKKN